MDFKNTINKILKITSDPKGKKKVLVVDDDPTTISLLKGLLKKEGLKVITAKDGQEGLKKVKQENPDLIIADVLMPVMDGFSFFDALKENKITDKKPILIITSRGNLEEPFLRWGAEAFMEKPIDGEKLRTIVAQLSHRLKNP